MRIISGDITKMDTDAIVNAASPDLKRCPGICEAIFAAGDSRKLEKACRDIGHCPIGHAVVTPAFGLPSRYIIHVAGSGWFSGTRRELFLLQNCFQSALHKAFVLQCRSVALPLMFSGEYHVPRADALRIAHSAICSFEKQHRNMDIVLVLYTSSIYALAQNILGPQNITVC